MNKRSFDANAPPPANGAPRRIARGVCRLLGNMGCATILEFKLRSRRRVDVIGLDRAGRFVIAEVKSSLVYSPPTASGRNISIIAIRSISPSMATFR